jgi:hypothetical protein
MIIYLAIDRMPEDLPEDQTAKIEKLQRERDSSAARVKDLQISDSLKSLKLDSLQTELISIRDHSEALTQEIDQDIKEDSTRALERNRRALRDLGIKTDTSPHLTFFEMGWNAKFLSENIGFKLQVRKLEEIGLEKDRRIGFNKEIISEQYRQLSKADSMLILADRQTDYYKNLFDETQSLFYDRFIFYGGAGINYDGTNLAPGIQFGFGLKIIAIKF